jgi:pilus assembly protein CpaF
MPSILERLNSGQTAATPESQHQTGEKPVTSPLGARRVAPFIASGSSETLTDLKTRVQNKLLGEMDPNTDVTKVEEVKKTIWSLFEQILGEENIILSKPEKIKLFEQITAEILGFGPLQTLLEDGTITEIMVNGANKLYIERAGKLLKVPNSFESNEHVMRIIDRIVAPLGRRIDESSPYVDARLPDGSRVNAVIPPISLVGPVLTIRKFSKNPITIDQLILFGWARV